MAIKWLPLAAMLSIMMMPNIIDIHVLPTLVVPAIFFIWAAVASKINRIYLSKNILFLIAFLLVSQAYLWIIGALSSPGSTLLGSAWVVLAYLIWSQSRYVHEYANKYLFGLIIASWLWMLVAFIVWFGLTDGKPLVVGGVALTQGIQIKPTGPFTNGNVFGLMMLCAWLVCSFYWLKENKCLSLPALLSLIFLMCVFTSMSRGAWLAWFIVSLYLLIWLIGRKQWKRAVYLVLLAVIAWFAASALISFNLSSININSRVTALADTNAARFVLYPSVFEVWKSHSLLGVGLGNLGGHYLTGQANAFRYLSQDLNGLGATYNAHNHLLQSLSEAGLVGFILWLVISFSLFRTLMKSRYNVLSNQSLFVLLAFIIWIQGLFNISMIEPIPFFLFFLFLGLAMSNTESEYKDIQKFKIAPVLMLFTALILVMQSIFLTQSWFKFERMLLTDNRAERGSLVSELLHQDYFYPRVIQQVASDMFTGEDAEGNLKLLQPHIIRAISIEEWPTLYQVLFYTYVLKQEWGKACELGHFLKLQHWKNDKNQEAYGAVCQGRSVQDFSIAW